MRLGPYFVLFSFSSLGIEGQGFCDNSTKAFALTKPDSGGGGQNLSKFAQSHLDLARPYVHTLKQFMKNRGLSGASSVSPNSAIREACEDGS